MTGDTPKARLPRGFLDRSESEIVAQHRMLETIKQAFELYGFEALETPFIEYTEALGKFLPDLDRPNEGVFSFQDDDEQWLSLRYDLTAPLARHVAEHFDAIPKPYRSYRAGYVFRNEKPGPGRFRQFMQFDADIVGAASVAADAEVCMLMADTLDKLGLAGQYVVKVNNRKVLDGVMEACGLAGSGKAGQRLTVLRAIDKLDRLGADGVRQLLGAGRKDESGDFTKGAALEADAIERILAYVSFEASPNEGGDRMAFWEKLFGTWQDVVGESETGREGIAELHAIMRLCNAAGYGHDRVRADASVVRGLEYYTGPVYEAELTFPVQNEDGQTVRFGSVAGGGRYDGLVGRFRSEPVPATGFSIGVSRLFSALQLVKSPLLEGTAKPGPVVVLVLDRENIAEYQAHVAALRNAGIRAELYLGSSGMKAQMKYADRRRSPIALIQGSNEREAGEIQIKDLIEGAKAAQNIGSNAEWKAARPAQVSVPVAEMVERVREILARHYG
ncbi:histidine--tRNA ligase [Methylobacterium haplocladii]|uniref:Histidine--tRNA ligase n=1 Tax=Methylobacterium haplocladii TaxID=1176176 RepID=A0A512ILP0_9HYPH|nr:histidine--tRNA ligase [Methylobacterium haplocladii]GEO98629.1 histidine--tRNA ligase [Methylobacterium haplocladii]GJD83970.1 Histidine--tRNA ligase [Methylobacterium haplocladii]GLS59476.1 histidine--tRNA ligase [Methylobacterium haplocladii]